MRTLEAPAALLITVGFIAVIAGLLEARRKQRAYLASKENGLLGLIISQEFTRAAMRVPEFIGYALFIVAVVLNEVTDLPDRTLSALAFFGLFVGICFTCNIVVMDRVHASQRWHKARDMENP